jgi:arginyl-tRNA synthetase
MNFFSYLSDIVNKELEKMSGSGVLPEGLDLKNVSVEPPRDSSHGDVATNAAMVLAKQAKMKPRDIADALAARLEDNADIETVEVAGPGFINMRLSPSFWHARLAEVLAGGAGYGTSDVGKGEKVNVEYVSANPTGPMHVGHARGAVVGDALARLLDKAGFDVTREYYINDAGSQIDVLAKSLHLRYREALGEDIGDIPEGLYPGDYLIPVGQKLAETLGNKWREAPDGDWLEEFQVIAIDAMMEMIRNDLAALGIVFNVFSSERNLVNAGEVEKAIAQLDSQGLIYEGRLDPPKGKLPDDWEDREQTLFKSSEFGDDTDRPIKKSDGSWTYFASDISYHRNKFERGFKTQIDVWGADHGGYVKRMKAAVQAISGGEAALDVKLCNLVKLLRDGEQVKMSKRSGSFVTLREVVDEVGRDVVRFIMLTRRNDAPLDFDFNQVTEQSRDNPVFYVQYAHARTRSVLRNAAETIGSDVLGDISYPELAKTDCSGLTDPDELALIKLMASWPRTVETAAAAHEPHRIAFYLHEVASAFHSLWNKGKDDVSLRFILEDDISLTRARLALIGGAASVIAGALDVMGVEALEELR